MTNSPAASTNPPGNSLRAVGWVAFATLLLFSIYLAATRIIQVDEAQQTFQAAILASGRYSSFYTYAPLHHLGPMTWAARLGGTAENIFLINRFLFLSVFWLNIFLLARICAGRWRGPGFLPWLLMAATLAPMWDYGFEIRHDNLLLTGLLLFWLIGRGSRLRPWLVYLLTGALAVVLEFIAFKAFLYWLPWLVVLILFPPKEFRSTGRFRLGFTTLMGVLGALALIRWMYSIAGCWGTFVAGFRGGIAVSASVERFSPMPALSRMSHEMPFVLSGALALILIWVGNFKAEGRRAITWDSVAPEVGLLIVVLGAFLANPTPFHYNLLFLAPFLLIAGSAWLSEREIPLGHAPWSRSLIAFLIFCHGVPFVGYTLRHLDYTMDRQTELMALAESLTDRNQDRIFDGIGLVPTRDPIGYDWFLHSLNIKSFYDGGRKPVRTMLEEHPAPVIILSYRTDWLPSEDKAFIRSRYLLLADDFLVLGGLLPGGGGMWNCPCGGRYEIRLLKQQSSDQGLKLSLDGQSIPEASVQVLCRGPHAINAPAGCEVRIAWVGPRLNELPIVRSSDHKQLFVNWY